jgi:hypothetical protein
MREARRVIDGLMVQVFGLQRHERKSKETKELLNNYFLLLPLCKKKVSLMFGKFPMKVLPVCATSM